MCGLVGAFRADGGIFVKAPQYITQGLFVSVLRGYSGCGVGLINSKYKPDLVKSRLSSPDFIQTKNYDWVENNCSSARVIMGHTRAPTTNGAVSLENSHPFWYHKVEDTADSVILTHNGHVNNYHSLTPVDFKHDVDSAHVTHSILLNGGVETLKKIQGYYVLTWYSEKDKKFHIARNNSNRDLFLAKNPTNDIIYYASEKEILQFCLDRLDIAYANKGTDEAFWQLEPYKMYSWDLTKSTLENPDIEEYEEKKIHTTSTVYRGGSTTSNHGAMPDAGTRIYVDCGNNEIVPYGNSSSHGYILATRRLDQGEVRVDGIHIEDWNSIYKYTRAALPCFIDHARQEIVGNVIKFYYKVRINTKEAVQDARRFLPLQAQPENKKKVEVETETLAIAVVDLPQPMCPGPNGTTIPLREWQEIAKQGCIGCHGTIILSLDKGKVLWYPWARCPEDPPEETEWQMICPICAKDAAKLTEIYGA